MDLKVLIVLNFIAVLYRLCYCADCPLQCECDRINHSVNCDDVVFKVLPKFEIGVQEIVISGKSSQLDRVQSDGLNRYKNLSRIHIQVSNSLKFEESSLLNIQSLKVFTINSKVSIPLPQNAFNGSQLEYLTLSSPVPEIPFSVLCKQFKLRKFTLRRSQVRNITLHECIKNLNDLQSLVLTNNPVTVLQNNAFYWLKRLQIGLLALGECKITTIEARAFHHLHSLGHLDLSKNRLTNLPDELFVMQTTLSTLYLSDNYFTTLPCKAFRHTPLLKTLQMRNNRFFKDAHICDEFRNLKITHCLLDGSLILNVSRIGLLPLPGVEILTITGRTFTEDAFIGTTNLKTLSILRGKSNYPNLTNAIKGLANGQTLEKLIIQNIGRLNELSDNLFIPLTNKRLQSLSVTQCYLTSIQRYAFATLSSLSTLDLSSNELTNFEADTFKSLVNVKTINLYKNKLVELNIANDRRLWGLQANIRQIYIQENRIKRISEKSLKGLSKLEHLNLSENQISTITKSNDHNFCSLKHLILDNNNLSNLRNSIFENCSKLEILSIKSNSFVIDEGSFAFFSKMTSLRHIYMFNQRFNRIFKNKLLKSWLHIFKELEILQLIDANIQALPVQMFQKSKKLQKLLLISNKISSWEPEVFQPLDRLEYLDLTGNSIATVNKEAFRYLPSLRVLHLALNQLRCDCNLIWFRKWLPKAHIYIPGIQTKKYFFCHSPEKYKDKQILEFNMEESDCRSYTFLKLGMTFAAAVILVLLLATVIYRNRLDLRLLVFYVRSRQARLLGYHDATGYQYDAFVVFDSGDCRWVTENLLPQMEDRRGYSLYFEQRNWKAGVAIAENIMESLLSCRKVILIITPRFCASPWCRETVDMALSHLAGTTNSNLIPVLLQKPDLVTVAPSLRLLISKHAYLQWAETQKGQRRFWKAINSAMKYRRRRISEIVVSDHDGESTDDSEASESEV